MDRGFIRPPKPIFRVLSVMVALIGCLFVYRTWKHSLGTMERQYLADYRNTVIPTLHPGQLEPYLIYVARVGKGVVPITDQNLQLGTWQARAWTRPVAHAWFAANIFHGQEPQMLYGMLVIWMVLVGAGCYGAGYTLDRQRIMKFRDQYRVLRGPEVHDNADEFNAAVKGTGIQFQVEEPGLIPIKALGKSGRFPWIKMSLISIEAEYEGQHVEIIGDTGSGKSVCIKQIVDQIEKHDETAVIFDSEREFIKRYLNTVRGDIIANPLDARCIRWDLPQEIDYTNRETAEATSMAMAESLWPGKPTDRDWFFVHGARIIFQSCMTNYAPHAAELAELFTHPDPLIDAIAKGTELEEMLKKNAEGQRAGLVSMLAACTFALRQIPAYDPNQPGWSVRELVQKRDRWMFLTSTEETIIALKPLQSLWIDSFIRGVLSMPLRKDLRKVWIVIDELASLQYLPQLVNAVNKGRKKDLTIVKGFQGRSQPKKLYQEDAETLLSAPYTKVLMRTSEAEAQKWMADMVGAQEIERISETRATGRRASHSYPVHQTMRPIALPSEFKGLENRKGFLTYGDHVLKIKLALPPNRPDVAPEFIPRVGTPLAIKQLPNLEDLKRLEEADRQRKANAMAKAVEHASSKQIYRPSDPEQLPLPLGSGVFPGAGKTKRKEGVA